MHEYQRSYLLSPKAFRPVTDIEAVSRPFSREAPLATAGSPGAILPPRLLDTNLLALVPFAAVPADTSARRLKRNSSFPSSAGALSLSSSSLALSLRFAPSLSGWLERFPIGADVSSNEEIWFGSLVKELSLRFFRVSRFAKAVLGRKSEASDPIFWLESYLTGSPSSK